MSGPKLVSAAARSSVRAAVVNMVCRAAPAKKRSSTASANSSARAEWTTAAAGSPLSLALAPQVRIPGEEGRRIDGGGQGTGPFFVVRRCLVVAGVCRSKTEVHQGQQLDVEVTCFEGQIVAEHGLVTDAVAVAAHQVDRGHRLMRPATERRIVQDTRERKCLLTALLGDVQIALLPSDVGCDPEQSRQQRMLHPSGQAERLVDEAQQVDPQAVVCLMGNHDGQPEQIFTRSTRAQERVGAPDFGEVGVESASRGALVRGHFTCVRAVGQRESPVAMLASQRPDGRFG